MTRGEFCWHWWLIWQERITDGQHRVRVRCDWCGRKDTWSVEQARIARNYTWWWRTQPRPKAS